MKIKNIKSLKKAVMNMNKSCFLLILFFINTVFVFAQNKKDYWSLVEEKNIELPSESVRYTIPDNYKTFKLDVDAVKKSLVNAPMEYTTAAKTKAVEVDIPLQDGSIETFKVYESPVMHPGLAARYPSIKTYAGESIKNPSTTVRMDITPKGLHALVFKNGRSTYIDPYAGKQDKFYISYYGDDLVKKMAHLFTCGVSDEHSLNLLEDHSNHAHEDTGDDHHDVFEQISDESIAIEDAPLTIEKSAGDPVVIRKYRLAVACTGEYTTFHGGTVESALAAINIKVNRLTGIFERELAIKLELIERNDEIIFLLGNSDPYTNGNTGAMLSENQPALDGILGLAGYDWGHVFGTGGWGGIASLATICGTDRAQSSSISGNPAGDAFTVQIVAHEMGHQMSAQHTMSSCHNVNSGTAYEPGSGSTMMSYAGICGNENNIVTGSDDYYHTNSLQAAMNYMYTKEGDICPEKIDTDNTTPDVTVDYVNGFYIPISTPFELVVNAIDAEGDELTYCWEQYDLGPMSVPGTPEGNCPLFRSFDPNNKPNRIFPRIGNIVNNLNNVAEILPAYSRDMTFRCTVRDNKGGTVWSDPVEFEATETAGPFRVMSPNTNITWEIGSYKEVVWDEANTSGDLVNCQKVDIALSLDGGFNYDIDLALGVPNDGSELVLIPADLEPSTTARIRVRAVGNIFFDISNQNFEIAKATTPNYSLAIAPNTQQVCLPDVVELEINTVSLLDYEEPINMSIVEGLPSDAVATFSNNPIQPGENAQLNIDFGDVLVEDTYEVLVEAIAPDADTTYRTITLTTVSNDFSTMELLSPADGTSGASGTPTFIWDTSVDADFYDIQIATNPSFSAESLVEEATGLTVSEYIPSIILEENTLYYWRVIPFNECGFGKGPTVKAFHTESLSCGSNLGEDTPIFITSSGAPTVESKINILDDGTISDINIPKLQGSHEFFSDISVTLTSPAGTVVTLFAGKCANFNGTFNLTLDDEAPDAFSCPPVGTYRPQQSLSAFIGESTKGLWVLEIKDSSGGAGGSLTDWSIEFCANINLSNPQLLVNETMLVNPGKGRLITEDFLKVEDDVNLHWELIYTILELPKNGTLYLDEEPLGVGDIFRQSDIFWTNVEYRHDGSDTQEDDFLFTIIDGEGGWTGSHRFNIDINDSMPVSNEEVKNKYELEIFPNPASNVINVQYNGWTNANLKVDLLNIHGQQIGLSKTASERLFQINTSNISSGIYLLRVQSEEGIYTEKVTIAK